MTAGGRPERRPRLTYERWSEAMRRTSLDLTDQQLRTIWGAIQEVAEAIHRPVTAVESTPASGDSGAST